MNRIVVSIGRLKASEAFGQPSRRERTLYFMSNGLRRNRQI